MDYINNIEDFTVDVRINHQDVFEGTKATAELLTVINNVVEQYGYTIDTYKTNDGTNVISAGFTKL